LAQVVIENVRRKQSVISDLHASALRPEELHVSSTRIGNVFGEHSVQFHSDADEIELIHRAHNRSGFAYGAVLAAEMTKEFKGICSFDKLVFNSSLINKG
ncbi:MAG: dihydrodipicolinate reductase C-terminal domain-containing protein, partial [Bacteroidota bacterium]